MAVFLDTMTDTGEIRRLLEDIFHGSGVLLHIYSFLWASVGGKSQAEEAKFLFDMCESLIGILSITAIKAMKQALFLKLNDEEENG